MHNLCIFDLYYRILNLFAFNEIHNDNRFYWYFFFYFYTFMIDGCSNITSDWKNLGQLTQLDQENKDRLENVIRLHTPAGLFFFLMVFATLH